MSNEMLNCIPVTFIQAFSNSDSGKSSTVCQSDDATAEEGTSSAGATTSLADEDHVTAERADDGSCSPSSVTIVDLDATIDDERRLELEDLDVDQGGSAAVTVRPTTLRVPTPSSWEKYRVLQVPAGASSPSTHSAEPSTTDDDADVKVVMVADVVKDEVDRRSTKKPCSCGALSANVQVMNTFIHQNGRVTDREQYKQQTDTYIVQSQ